jgi:hypothetical protein
MNSRAKKWSDFSTSQQALIILLGILQVSLFAAAVYDILKRPADQINRPKPFWFAVSLVNFIGPISYFLFGRKRSCC